jgi:hypothetical protein
MKGHAFEPARCAGLTCGNGEPAGATPGRRWLDKRSHRSHLEPKEIWLDSWGILVYRGQTRAAALYPVPTWTIPHARRKIYRRQASVFDGSGPRRSTES